MKDQLPIQITKDKLDILFPFHFIMDSSGMITDFGPSFSKIIPLNGLVSFDQTFAFKRPKRTSLLFSSIHDIVNSVIILEYRHCSDVVLRGQLVYFQEGYLLFAGSPWMTDVNDLELLNLKVTDFAIHNTITDLLQIIKVKEIVMNEIKMLVTTLTKQKNELNIISNRLSTLIQNLHSGVLLEDENRNIVLANKEFCKLFSIPVVPEYLIGMDCSKSLAQSAVLFQDEEGFVQGVDEVIANKTKKLAETLYLKDGTILQRDFIPIYQQKKYLGHLWIYTNVTSKVKNLEIIKQNEEKYRSIIENFNLGLLEVDNDHSITRVYDGFCRMTGYMEEELLGRKATDLLDGREYEYLMKNETEKRQSGVSSVYEVKIKTKIGQPIWVLISGSPIYDENQRVIGSIGIHKDITIQKEREIHYKQAKEIAEESVLLKKQIIANVSHELRTPIHAIKALSEVLMNNEWNGEKKEDLQSIHYSANHLLAIVQDLLEIAKIESGKNKTKQSRFNFKTAVLKLAHNYNRLMAEKGLLFDFKLDPSIPEFIMGDENKVVQVLNNLLSNAVKFTHAGRVQFHVLRMDGEKDEIKVKIIVADTGIGIPHDKVRKVFESFVQAHNDTSKVYGGTGLGLSITKSIVDQLRGTIEVNSRLNEGSVFLVQLPFKKATPLKSTPLVSIKGSTKSDKIVHILVVEDNVINQKVLQRQLAPWNVDCIYTMDGKQAIEQLEKAYFDVLLLDIQLPGMDGHQITKWVRSHVNPKINQLRIIGLSAHASVADRAKAKRNGMNGFLSKPFSQDDLFQVLYGSEKKKKVKSSDQSIHWDYLNGLSTEKTFQDEFLKTFLKEIKSSSLQLNSACSKRDHDNIRFYSHKLKGSFKVFGVKKLIRLLTDLECNSKVLSRKRELDKVLKETQELIQFVQKEIKTGRGIT